MGIPGKQAQSGGHQSPEKATDAGFLDNTLSGDSELNQQTACSNCQTVFEVSMELLASSDTRVRCGECLSIFDALANLRNAQGLDDDDMLVDSDGNVISALHPSVPDDPDNADDSGSYHEMSNLPDAGAAALAGLSNDTSSLDVTYSDFDLFSGDAGLPEVAYLDQTVDSSGFDFDDLTDVEDDETFSDTLFAHDVTVDARSTVPSEGHSNNNYLHDIAGDSDIDYISDEVPREALIFNYRERELRTPVSPVIADDRVDKPVLNSGPHQISVSSDNGSSSWWLRSGLLLVVLALAASLYAYRERDTLHNNVVLRPVLESACSVFGCTLPERVDLAALKVLKRSVFSHPSIDNALIINIEFVNEAAFGQRYPVLEIRLTDRNGRLVVKNNFLPKEYLKTWQPGDLLDSGKRLAIRLNVQDPGSSAMSFELDFR